MVFCRYNRIIGMIVLRRLVKGGQQGSRNIEYEKFMVHKGLAEKLDDSYYVKELSKGSFSI